MLFIAQCLLSFKTEVSEFCTVCRNVFSDQLKFLKDLWKLSVVKQQNEINTYVFNVSILGPSTEKDHQHSLK